MRYSVNLLSCPNQTQLTVRFTVRYQQPGITGKGIRTEIYHKQIYLHSLLSTTSQPSLLCIQAFRLVLSSHLLPNEQGELTIPLPIT